MVWNGAIVIVEANRSRLVVCKQMGQEFIAAEKQSSVKNKFQKKRYNIYNNRPDLLLQTSEPTFVITIFVVGRRADCCRGY